MQGVAVMRALRSLEMQYEEVLLDAEGRTGTQL
jgi:hypothetical protein